MRNFLVLIGTFLITSSLYSQVTVFSEDFTNINPSWVANDIDGDGNNWYLSDFSTLNPPFDVQGNVLTSESWNNGPLTPDNYLISPSLDLTTATGTVELSFVLGATDANFFSEYISVYVTTDTSYANLLTEIPIHQEALTADGAFPFTYDISSFAGQSNVFIVFRHHNVSDEFIVFLDDVLVTATTFDVSASFSADATLQCVGSDIEFTDLSLGAITDYAWDFGDGMGTSTDQNPIYTYAAPGTYTVSLTINNGADTETLVDYITIIDAITIDPISDQTVCQGATTTDVVFSSTGGTGNPTYEWVYTNTNGDFIGIADNGFGDIAGFVAENPNPTPLVSKFYYIAYEGQCLSEVDSFEVTINPSVDFDLVYTNTSFCTAVGSETPTFLGTGTFSALPAGLTIDANTGEIDLNSSSNGNFTVTLTDGNACELNNTATIQIGVGSATVDPIVAAEFCDGDLTSDIVFTGSVGATFSWVNDNLAIGLAASGNGDVPSFTAVNGTGSPVVANITVTPNDGTCDGNPETFTITINDFEDASFTLSATSSCASGNDITSDVTGIAGGTFSAGIGMTIDANTGVIDVSNSVPGSYMVTYTSPGTCFGTSNESIDILPTPIIAPITDVEVCEGILVPTLNIDMLSTDDVNWLNDNTATGIINGNGVGDIASFIASVSAGSISDTSHIELFASNGTCSSDTVRFDVIVNALPTVNAGNNMSFCEGQTITLSGTGNATLYTWDNGIVDGVAFTPNEGNYIYTVTGTLNNCINMDQVNVDVLAVPVVSAGQDRIACAGSEITLTGSGAATLLWNNGILNNVPFVPAFGGEYIVTGIGNNGCENSDTMELTIEALPVPSFTYNVFEGCIPTQVIFNSDPTTNVCVYEFGDGTIGDGCTNIAHTYSDTGYYDVTLRQVSINGCIGETSVANAITIHPDPVVSFTADKNQIDMINNGVLFTNTSIDSTNTNIDAVNYEWDFGHFDGYSNVASPFHAFPEDEAQDFTVQLVGFTVHGCTDTATMIVSMEESVIFHIPNSFTPNGDEFNNTFKPVMYSGFDPKDYKFQIFNRYGEIIFTSYDASIGWDGDYGAGRGLAPAGVYTFKITFDTTTNDEKRVYTGSVSIIR